MFAHDLCHSQIEYLSLRLVDPTARRGILSILIEKTARHAAQALRERLPQIFNFQYSIVNSGVGFILKWELTSITFLNFNSVSNILSLGIPKSILWRITCLISAVPNIHAHRLSCHQSFFRRILPHPGFHLRARSKITWQN
jgi:hypothetical protein